MTSRINTTLGIITVILLSALLIGIGGLLFARPAVAQDSGVPGMRQITVNGSGEVRVSPDIATVQIGVETEAATAQEALQQNNTQMQATIDQMLGLGVAREDIQTSNLSIFPVYDRDGRAVTGYRVSNTVAVTIRNLESAGALLDAVVQAGANNLYGISFNVSDPEAVLDAARENAMRNAQTRATQLAAAAGASVGQVLLINESSALPAFPIYGRGELASAAADVPVEAGQQTLNVQVTVTFELR